MFIPQMPVNAALIKRIQEAMKNLNEQNTMTEEELDEWAHETGKGLERLNNIFVGVVVGIFGLLIFFGCFY